jgi:hypothetical protein
MVVRAELACSIQRRPQTSSYRSFFEVENATDISSAIRPGYFKVRPRRREDDEMGQRRRRRSLTPSERAEILTGARCDDDRGIDITGSAVISLAK